MSARDDLAPLNADRAATLGVYETHRFCLRLSSSVSLLTDDGAPKSELDVNVLVTLLHEYMHFLHNLSTASSFASYQCYQRLLGVFSHALCDDGTCDPTKLLPDHAVVVRSALESLESIEGTRELPDHPSPVTGLSVKGVSVEHATVEWAIDHRDGSRRTRVCDLGALVIEEGIAFTLEECVRLQRVTFERSDVNPPPIYPYEALRILAQHCVADISALSTIRLGLLALSMNRPGATLLRILDAYKRLRDSGVDDVAACKTVRQQMDEMLKRITERICSTDLGEISKMHSGRGLVAEGHASIQEYYRRYLTQRANDPWFDIAWCREDGTLDLGALSTLLLSTVPCDTIQKRCGSEDAVGRDVLLTFTSGTVKRDDNTPANSGLRVVQAQFDYLLAHLSPSQGIVEARQRRCPYFTTCTLKMRQDDPATCKEAPWRRLTKNGETCWYGAAVAGTLGTSS